MSLKHLKQFEGVCVRLDFDPHEECFDVSISAHNPEDLADKEHERHHRADSGVTTRLTAEEMRSFEPGKRYVVTISEHVERDRS